MQVVQVDGVGAQPLQATVHGLPHIRGVTADVRVLGKRLEPEARDWYAAIAVEYGWSRNVLLNMIMNKTLERTGAAPKL